ncbi:hypothetical protein [Gemmobacter sp. 24YEA27]|nr:hypothetical protein [Gemmobacter sp. 24YEA27]
MTQHLPTRAGRMMGSSAAGLRWLVILGCTGFWTVILYLLLA